MWVCKKCKVENPDTANLCQSCGEMKASERTSSFAQSFNKEVSTPRPEVSTPWLSVVNYIKTNSTAEFLESLSNIYIVVGSVLSMIFFFGFGKFYALVANSRSDFSFFAGLIAAVTVLSIYVINGYLIKAVGSIVQNTENTANYLKFQCDLLAQEKSKK